MSYDKAKYTFLLYQVQTANSSSRIKRSEGSLNRRYTVDDGVKCFGCDQEGHLVVERTNTLGSLFGRSDREAKSSSAVSDGATVPAADDVNREDGDISSRVISTRQRLTATSTLQSLGFG